jgi:hypothetical protein
MYPTASVVHTTFFVPQQGQQASLWFLWFTVFVCSALLETLQWRVGGVMVGSRGLITTGQDANHSSLRPLWFMLFICSSLLESRVG